ncbi:MAG: DHH family phosphoesterase, partial [Planctomycetota bacterium]
LGTLSFCDHGRVATMCITEEMFRQTGLGPVDTEGFAEIPVTIRGVQASALLKEMPRCRYIKVSLRSRESVDVCAVAHVFGGGGHKHAAGCEVADTLENVRQAVADQLEAQVRTAAP